MQVESRNLLQNPRLMKEPLEERNMTKYCKFHKDRGHDKSECFHLRDQIEALIQGEYLQEYISGLVTASRQTATAPRASSPTYNASTSNLGTHNDGLPHEVCTISGGHTTDDSAKARKDNVRLARDVARDHQINMTEHVAKLSKRENIVISFTDDEARRLIHPHIDALVVTLNVANEIVFRMSIETRSFANILFASVFHQMNVGGATPRQIKTPLYGFSREKVYVEGAI